MKRFTRPILITLDAFDTLLAAHTSVAHQYSEFVHNVCGIKVPVHEIHYRFARAFVEMTKQHPNYGRQSQLNVQHWWTEILTSVFDGFNVPSHAVLALYEHFSSGAPYHVFPDALGLLRQLSDRDIAFGILSNSDPRMRKIVNSLMSLEDKRIPYFLSYETGFEKPNLQAFRCVEKYLEKTKRNSELSPTSPSIKSSFSESLSPLSSLSFSSSPHQEDSSSNSSPERPKSATGTRSPVSSVARYYAPPRVSLWHAGDDLEKDYQAATDAGWNSILVDRTGENYDEKERLEKLSIFSDSTMTVAMSENGQVQVHVTDMTRIAELFEDA